MALNNVEVEANNINVCISENNLEYKNKSEILKARREKNKQILSLKQTWRNGTRTGSRFDLDDVRIALQNNNVDITVPNFLTLLGEPLITKMCTDLKILPVSKNKKLIKYKAKKLIPEKTTNDKKPVIHECVPMELNNLEVETEETNNVNVCISEDNLESKIKSEILKARLEKNKQILSVKPTWRNGTRTGSRFDVDDVRIALQNNNVDVTDPKFLTLLGEPLITKLCADLKILPVLKNKKVIKYKARKLIVEKTTNDKKPVIHDCVTMELNNLEVETEETNNVSVPIAEESTSNDKKLITQDVLGSVYNLEIKKESKNIAHLPVVEDNLEIKNKCETFNPKKIVERIRYNGAKPVIIKVPKILRKFNANKEIKNVFVPVIETNTEKETEKIHIETEIIENITI